MRCSFRALSEGQGGLRANRCQAKNPCGDAPRCSIYCQIHASSSELLTESQLREPAHERSVLRKQLIERRREWLSTPASHAADVALARQLHELLMQLEPLCLGLYWPLPGEFNASVLLQREDD